MDFARLILDGCTTVTVVLLIPLAKYILALGQRVSNLEHDGSELKTDVKEIKDDVKALKLAAQETREMMIRDMTAIKTKLGMSPNGNGKV